MKHKLLSILLCLAMALSLLPTAALAEETGTSETSIDLNTFITWLESSNYSVDGSTYTANQNAVVGGKLVVKWSPVSGCFELLNGGSNHGLGVDCPNTAATGNTPKRVNNGLTQFQLFDGKNNAVTVKNVKFVYEPAYFKICANSGWKGSFTAEQAPAGQLYFMTTGSVSFENCDFDKVVLTSFNTTSSTTVKDCSFKNVYNNYAIKDIRGANISVTGTTIENCGGGIMVSSIDTVNNVTITGNTFKDVDVAGTAAEGKVGTRAILQIANSGTYTDTAFDFGSNTATGCGPVVRQLNDSAKSGVTAKAEELKNLVPDGSTLYTSDSKASEVAQTKDGAMYNDLTAALNVVSGTNPLVWVSEEAWPAATPVYWKAGDKSGYVAKLTDALTAAYKAKADDITIVCRPGAGVGTMTHGHVADNLTIYGNNAYISGGECDLEVDTYMYSRETGKQVTENGVYLDKDITITAYELDNLGVWGQRTTNHTVTVNLTDCDGNSNVTPNVQRVYISGATGVNNITLKDCDFITNNTSVYSNADGAVVIDNCSFTGSQVPVNFNHEATGTQTVTVSNSTFTECGNNGGWAQFAAPIRFVNSGSGTSTTTVDNCTFNKTVGSNGDILIGDGRTGKESNDVTLKVKNTAADVQAQKPGYYAANGTVAEAGKVSKTTIPASETPTTIKLESNEDFMLAEVNGFKTSNLREALSNARSSNKPIKLLSADTALVQAILDGQYGSIDGLTIELPTGNYGQLELGRATKYPGSGTTYHIGGFDKAAMSFNDFYARKNDGTYSASSYYIRSMSNVTLKAADGASVKIAGVNASSGHKYASENTPPVYDYVLDKQTVNGSSHYLANVLENITFDGLTFTAKSDINTSLEQSNIDRFTFKNCTFNINNTATGNQAIRYYNENDNGKVSNLVVDNCKFNKCYQGVYTSHIKNVIVTNSEFDMTGHNAIAIQDFKDACNHGKVIITGNTFKNIGDRIIRFGNVGADTQITITHNTVIGELIKKEVIKAESLADGVTCNIHSNSWGAGTTVANDQFKDTAAPSYSGSSSSDPTYSVSTPSKTENGGVTVSPKSASKGDTVTVTVKPDSGYVLETLTVTDKNGNELTLKDKGNGKYTFTMPAGKVEVKATFMEDNSMLNFFYDVPNNAYFYEAVKWAVKNGITTGVGNDLFAPEQPCTRAQIVTFLWRAAGSPEPKGAASGMTDVVSGSYYEKAVAWAIENGITTGTTTSTFSPDVTCTRAQAVTFLARALKAKAASAAEFSDVPTGSYFADAVAWAAANGVTEGIGGGLFGSDNDCTRGQIVTFLYRAYNK